MIGFMDQAILDAKRELDAANRAYKEACIAAQLACEHQDIVETRREKSECPPWRVCRDCGYAAEGFGFHGFGPLSDVPQVDWEEAIKYVHGGVMDTTINLEIMCGMVNFEEALRRRAGLD